MIDSGSVGAEAQQAVLDFWFGAPGSADDGTVRDLWFRKRADTDTDIATRFGPLIERALRGELADWAVQPSGALAQILLLDQFTHNSMRDTARAFAGDPSALRAATAMVGARQDLALPPIRRAFVYLPFEHAESLAHQDEAVRLFTALAAEAPETVGMLDYAEKHRAVVERFGRFPHRNAILARQSTLEETHFLRQPGSHF